MGYGKCTNHVEAVTVQYLCYCRHTAEEKFGGNMERSKCMVVFILELVLRQEHQAQAKKSVMPPRTGKQILTIQPTKK